MTREQYVIHYTVTDRKNKKELTDKMIGVSDPKIVVQAIKKFFDEHNYVEEGTKIMREVSPSISDAFVAYGENRIYWLIIHTLDVEVPA